MTDAERIQLRELANAAYPINDDEWGSERQIDAQNAFFEKCEEHGLDCEDPYFLKATTEEMVKYALSKLDVGLFSPHPMGGEEIEQAVKNVRDISDLDAVCLRLQTAFNIESGDGAGVFFSGDRGESWFKSASQDEREKQLIAWLEWELNAQE